MSTWKFLLTDRYGTPVGELVDATARNVSLRLNRVTTGNFTIPTQSSIAKYARLTDQTLIKAYRNGVLMAHGPLVPSYQKQVSEQSRTILVNWSGVGWKLGARIIEASKSTSGVTYSTSLAGIPGQPMDRGAMAQSIINGLNSAPVPGGSTAPYADTGIRVGTISPSSSTVVGPWYYKNALQAITELSAPLDGFDWEIVPVEPTTDVTGLQLGTFNCSAAIGTSRPDVVWEYGDGKFNVASFTEVSDFTGAMNRGYSLPQAFPDTSAGTVLTAYDATAIQTRGALYEDIVQTDLTVDDMRTRLLQQNVAVRKQPKTVITFVPSVSVDTGVVPQYGTDWKVGDTFQFRAVEYGVETVNALFRCFGVDFSIDDSGAETATPILLSTEQ